MKPAMKIVEIDTGLFPDAARVDAALAALEDTREVARFDARGLDPNDDPAWEEIAMAVLRADLIVTL